MIFATEYYADIARKSSFTFTFKKQKHFDKKDEKKVQHWVGRGRER